ncbi:bifunctional P-450:NADPH-P450 reductase [Annulohypoxylon maeteangense]|uniref:bifunctional P-450:NADPH-P450 reductase n=1 Tax=Annulohypoxylon maeteangense TaxID=1927788 RepID=UPI002007FC7E|nr:bifunctional P-450:NADPH-P450 reductase [Annulohypoxylon maeteangense]KAI0886212.1 bifunctional P-450:NADPH-P450 reductase [Annulohypoxylon maeteangense]
MSHPIPKPPGVPLLGNVFDITPSNTWESLRALSEQYGEIFQIKVLGKTVVFVAGAALAEEICDEKRFRKYVGGPIVEIRYAVHDALFTAFDDEPSWGIAHRILAPRLSPSVLKDHFVEMRDCASELATKWKGLGASNEISPINELNRLNLEATTLTMFGKKLNCLSGPEHPMLKGMEDSTSEAIMRPTRPGFLNWLFYGNKFKSATSTMREYAQDLVDYRKANPTDRQDILTAMMGAKDPETGTTLRDSQVIDEIVSMPIGSSTAPALLAHTIYLLTKNPEVVTKAREELDAVIGPDGEFRYEHLAQLKYIEGIVRESLRLSFAAPGFNIEPIPSESKAPVLLGGGKYQVAHNQAMIIVLAGVNRDPTVFQKPLAFQPERMMGEAFDELPSGVKKWFGNGKRECIGKHWAWQWSMTTLAKLIHEFDFEAVDPSYMLEQDGWFNLRPVGFQARVKPRA